MLLSKLLTLEDYGYYTVAGAVAGAIYMIIAPIAQATYPRLVELHTQRDQVELARAFHQSAQLVSLATTPAMLVIALYPERVLYLWSGDTALAAKAAPILVPLVLGTFLNGLMWIPYQAQLAHGWTALALRVNFIAVAVLVPMIIWLVPIYGAPGAAWIWVTLNGAYTATYTYFMFRKILTGERWRWCWNAVTKPLLVGAVFGLAIRHATAFPQSCVMLAAALVAVATFLAVVIMWSMPATRVPMWRYCTRWMNRTCRRCRRSRAGGLGIDRARAHSYPMRRRSMRMKEK